MPRPGSVPAPSRNSIAPSNSRPAGPPSPAPRTTQIAPSLNSSLLRRYQQKMDVGDTILITTKTQLRVSRSLPTRKRELDDSLSGLGPVSELCITSLQPQEAFTNLKGRVYPSTRLYFGMRQSYLHCLPLAPPPLTVGYDTKRRSRDILMRILKFWLESRCDA